MTTRFSDFELGPELLKGIADVGYESPTPIQAKTIELLLSGRDVIGCAQTGTGKTAAFSLPILQKIVPGGPNPQALIIAPTRELADQVHKSIVDYSQHMPVKTVVVYGGASSRFQEHQLRDGVDILVATPGRLLDHVRNRLIRLYDLKFLILDEADRMLDMGFIPDIEEILSYVPRQRQTLLFSATMPPAIEKLAHKMTQDAEMVVAGNRSSTASSVTQSVYHIQKNDKHAFLLKLLKQNELTSVIIFTRTKIGAGQLASTLIQAGINAAPIHSNLTQIQRERALDGFRQGTFKVLVATDIAARGIDINHVSHVINFDTPTHAEDYVHRIGRTGRAEATGIAMTFTSREEMKYLQAIEKFIGHSIPVAEASEGAKRSEQPARPRARAEVKEGRPVKEVPVARETATRETATAARREARPARPEKKAETLAPAQAPRPEIARARAEAPQRVQATPRNERQPRERKNARQQQRMSSENAWTRTQPAVNTQDAPWTKAYPPATTRAATSPRHFFLRDEVEYLN